MGWVTGRRCFAGRQGCVCVVTAHFDARQPCKGLSPVSGINCGGVYVCVCVCVMMMMMMMMAGCEKRTEGIYLFVGSYRSEKEKSEK